MFMTNPNLYPARAAAAVELLKLEINAASSPKEDPREAQYVVLHDLWLDQIVAKIEKQGSKSKNTHKLRETLHIFAPPPQQVEPDQSERI